jgi:hypothetical protein
MQRENRFDLASSRRGIRDCLRLHGLSLAVGREHLGAVLADEVLPLPWGEIAARLLKANCRCAFRRRR